MEDVITRPNADLDRLCDLHGETEAAAEDRMLRLSGRMLLEHDPNSELFEAICARAVVNGNSQPSDSASGRASKR